MSDTRRTDVLSVDAVSAILGVPGAVPLSPVAMAKSLHVTFSPGRTVSGRVAAFSAQLHDALVACGVTVLPHEQALADPVTEKLQEGIVVIAPGELESGNLPVDHVTNLRRATIVGIVDGPCPADLATASQEKLNSIVKMLAWNIVQVVIYVDDTAWTVCTMNGAIIRCSMRTLREEAFSVLVPKLAAPVVPPHANDFDVREGGLDLHDLRYRPYVQDFQESGKLWSDTGLMLFHTSLESLAFRNRYYKRLAAAYLDHRSGMSYGFLARQLAVDPPAALTAQEAREGHHADIRSGPGVFHIDGALHVTVNMPQGPMLLRVPDIWVLTTRSGCDKSNIDPQRDLVMLGLSQGRIIFSTPRGVGRSTDYKPSYDTLTILSHAMANALVAGLLNRIHPDAWFTSTLRTSGMALAHWHGYLQSAALPEGYLVHGNDNPPVSCSTFQAAIYALRGKIEAYSRSLSVHKSFTGDAHVEPHHGINLTGPTLLWLAQWALERLEVLTELQAQGTMAGERMIAVGR